MREGWSYKKLEDCFPYIKNGANIKQIKDAEGLPITRIETLSNGLFNRDKMGYANIMEIGKYSEYILEDQDLLMSHINSKTYIGRTVEYKKEGDEVIIHGMNLLKLKADKSVIIPRFFYYYSFSYKFKFDVSCVRKDAVNQSSMAIGDLKRFSLPIPPLPTQQQIVSELDLLSHILDQKRQQLKEYDALAESIFYDMFGDPVENPKGWEKKKLGDICSQIKDGVHAKPQYVDFGVPFISVININKGVLNLSDCKYVSQEAYAKMSKSFKAEKGDILYSKVGATYGIPALVDTDQEFGLYVSVSLLKPKREIVLPLFLKISMGLRYIKDQADKGIKGIGVPDLHLSVIKEFQVLLPPLTLQRSFASKIQSIEHQKQLLRASIKETEMLFQSRMDYWFNS